jgi:large subunit ribosomal protein L10
MWSYAMERSQKSETIELLKGVFADAGAVVVTHYDGLTVKETEDLRARLRASGAKLKMVKNTLAQKALNGAGEGALNLFTGPVAIAFGPDAVSAAKVSTQYAKENEKLKIIGGLMGAQVLDARGVDTLAKLPSLDELRGKLLGLINAPATRIAGVLQAPAAQIARVISAHAEKAAA